MMLPVKLVPNVVPFARSVVLFPIAISVLDNVVYTHNLFTVITNAFVNTLNVSSVVVIFTVYVFIEPYENT